jgi:hypothetical protein
LEAGISLISADAAHDNKENLVIVNLCLISDMSHKTSTKTSNQSIVEKVMPSSEFNLWRSSMVIRFADLFKLLTGVPLGSPDNFHIVTDPLAKLVFHQPYS